MTEIAAWLNIIGLIALSISFYHLSKADRQSNERRDRVWMDLQNRIMSLEASERSSLTQRVNLSGKVKDLEVEVHNFQDHLARNDKDVIDLNRTFSKLRPVYKIVMPREEILKPKLKPRARVSQ